MKTVLYATDYSDNAIAALKYAQAISSKIGARLKVVHIFDYPTMLDDLDLKGEAPFPDIEGDAFRKHHSKLNDFCTEHLKGNLNELNVEIEAIEDKSVVDGIIAKAEQSNALLLVTGMKGRSAIRELLMGNTTRHLLKKSPCPVLSIPDDARHVQIDTIVYATDFEDEDIGALKSLLEIAGGFGAELRVLHITTLEEDAFRIKREGFKKMLDEHVVYEKLSLEVVLSEDIFNTLKIYLDDVNADLVAMLERKDKRMMKKWFHRDLVKKMEVFGRVPLISFNESNYQ